MNIRTTTTRKHNHGIRARARKIGSGGLAATGLSFGPYVQTSYI